MKVSIITVVKNNKNTILKTMQSVFEQDYNNIEYIIIDGKSTDGTTEIINLYKTKSCIVVNESDQGVYYAMNKGISIATGDIIGFINGDDFYASNKIITNVISVLETYKVDACYGDLIYFKKEKVPLRYWKSRQYKKGLFSSGWAPPHPTFFIKRKILKKYGNFNVVYKIAADFELMMRLLEIKQISVKYIPVLTVFMRVGGISNKNLKNIYIQNKEIINILKENNLFKNIFYFIANKLMVRVKQYLKKN